MKSASLAPSGPDAEMEDSPCSVSISNPSSSRQQSVKRQKRLGSLDEGSAMIDKFSNA